MSFIVENKRVWLCTENLARDIRQKLHAYNEFYTAKTKCATDAVRCIEIAERYKSRLESMKHTLAFMNVDLDINYADCKAVLLFLDDGTEVIVNVREKESEEV